MPISLLVKGRWNTQRRELGGKGLTPIESADFFDYAFAQEYSSYTLNPKFSTGKTLKIVHQLHIFQTCYRGFAFENFLYPPLRIPSIVKSWARPLCKGMTSLATDFTVYTESASKQ